MLPLLILNSTFNVVSIYIIILNLTLWKIYNNQVLKSTKLKLLILKIKWVSMSVISSTCKPKKLVL